MHSTTSCGRSGSFAKAISDAPNRRFLRGSTRQSNSSSIACSGQFKAWLLLRAMGLLLHIGLGSCFLHQQDTHLAGCAAIATLSVLLPEVFNTGCQFTLVRAALVVLRAPGLVSRAPGS
jgi:hypothetical protein